MQFLTFNHLLKGGIFVTILWWFWFKKSDAQQKIREQIISTIIACMSALFIARVLALSLPFRPRPLQSSDTFFVIPYTIDRRLLDTWSAFPSDHAVLFFAFSVCFFYISRSAGIFALFYTVVFICIPKVYLGLHYPSDIIAGALIGAVVAWVAHKHEVNRYPVRYAMKWLRHHQGSFYAVFFLLTHQVAAMFDSVRSIGNFLLVIFR